MVELYLHSLISSWHNVNYVIRYRDNFACSCYIYKSHFLFKHRTVECYVSSNDIFLIGHSFLTFRCMKELLQDQGVRGTEELRAAHLWGLLYDPINFPVRERKRFIFLLILESVSIRLMLTSDCFSPDTQSAESAAPWSMHSSRLWVPDFLLTLESILKGTRNWVTFKT
jgi:hypothetical protein